MRIFKFTNRQENIKFKFYNVSNGIFCLIMILSENVYATFLCLLFILIFGILLLRLMRRVNESIEEIMVNGNDFRFHYFKKSKGKIDLPQDKIKITVEDERVLFEDISTSTLIGIAHKNMLEDISDWQGLTCLDDIIQGN